MRILLALGAAVLCSAALSAQAKEVNWSLVLPTEYEDGHALPQSDLAEVRIYVDGVARSFPVQVTGVLDLPSGSYSICATVVTKPDSYGEGQESACSNSLQLNVTAPKPKPPTLLEVVMAFIKWLLGWFA